MPVDLSEIEAFVHGNAGQRCGLQTVLAGEEWRGAKLLEGDVEKLVAALPQMTRFSNSALSKWLKSKGIDLGDSAVGRHRKGDCRCGRS